MQQKLRLKKSSDFGRAFKEGARVYSPHFALYMRENALPNSRFGMSVSKNHLKLATRRNRLRRIAQGLFANEIMPVVTNRDFVLASRKKGIGNNFNDDKKEIKKLIAGVKH